MILLPWLFLYGISGLLFNHPNIGSKLVGRPLSEETLAGYGVEAWSPRQMATAVLSKLNQRPGISLSLVDGPLPELTGTALLRARAQGAQHNVLLNLEHRRGVIATRFARGPHPDKTPFGAEPIVLPEQSMSVVAKRLRPLLRDRGIDALEPLRAHPQIAPQVRFLAQDGAGKRWNVSYHTGSGSVEARASELGNDIGLAQWLGRLHVTHHFGGRLGARWFWALFQDALGLAMAFWAVTGMVMWWAMKGVRRWGALSLVTGLALAGWVVWGTSEDLMFGPVREALGP